MNQPTEARQLEQHLEASSRRYQVHESSYVDEPCQIGDGTQIWHFCHILKDTVIGQGCKIGQNVVIGPRVTVGNHVKIQNNVSIYPGVTLEDDVFCGPSMVFTNVFNPRSAVPRNTDADFLQTRVKKGASIGANATIVCGSTIGEYAFIGAGAVVTKDVPAYALVYGNPARQHGWICRCGEKLPTSHVTAQPSEVACPECHSRYQVTEHHCQPVI
ncbi:MAG: DapH/DapD/GlmU-related protein [Candidatus Melainabacteria bacterium]|nr:DapH/DapD/GlmU-related protein [Candidatus Melainabacteria bacterium]